jgi:hypothetical protein
MIHLDCGSFLGADYSTHFAKIPIHHSPTPSPPILKPRSNNFFQPTQKEDEIKWDGWWGMRLGDLKPFLEELIHFQFCNRLRASFRTVQARQKIDKLWGERATFRAMQDRRQKFSRHNQRLKPRPATAVKRTEPTRDEAA